MHLALPNTTLNRVGTQLYLFSNHLSVKVAKHTENMDNTLYNLHKNPGKNPIKRIVPLIGVFTFIWSASIVMFLQQGVVAYDTLATCSHEISEWVTGTPIPDKHLEGAAAVVDGKLYLIGGFSFWSAETNLLTSQTIHVYDPTTNTWETRNEAPTKLTHAQAAVDGRHIWLAGGFEGDNPGRVTDHVWRYDTVRDRWSEGPPLPERRASGGLVAVDGVLHYIGGLAEDRATDVNTHWSLDITAWEADPENTTWQTVSEFPRLRNHFQAVHINGYIYAVGGQTGHDGPNMDIDWLDAYNMETGQWEERANLPIARSHFEAGTFVMNERIVIISGKSRPSGQGNAVKDVSEYNPQTDTWTELTPLPVGLYEATAAMIDGRIYVTAGGRGWNELQNEMWVADILTSCANHPPETTVDTYTYAEPFAALQTFASVLDNDTDPEDQRLRAELVSDVGHGTLNLRPNGRFTYTPDDTAARLGQVFFTYQATDGVEVSEPTIVTIVVPNPAPIAERDRYEAAYNTPLVVRRDAGVLLNDTDPNNDRLRARVIELPESGLLEFAANGAFTYTSPDDFAGRISFRYVATDGTSESEPARVVIRVNEEPTPTPEPTDNNSDPITQTSTPQPTDENGDPITQTPLPTDDDPDVTATETPDTVIVPPVVLPPPPPPTLITDSNHGIVTPVLTWTLIGIEGETYDAEWYHIIIVDENGNIVLDTWYPASEICDETSCTLTLDETDLPYGLTNGDYVTYINAWVNGETTEYTEPVTFTVEAPAPAPPVIIGVDVSTGRPILTIEDDPGVAWVNVYVGTTETDRERISMAWYRKTEAVCDGQYCTFVLDAHPSNGDYEAYLRTWGPAGFVDNNPNHWVGPYHFSLNFPAPVFIPDMTLAPNIQPPRSLTFNWLAPEGATWYQIWVGTDAPDYDTAHAQWYTAIELGCAGGGTCTLTPELSLQAGQNHTWFVRAWGPGGLTTGGLNGWSQGEVFQP